MWSDNDIDNAFQRLNPPEPEPTPFPLDAWLRLETELDKAVIERAVRRRLWKFFAAEMAVVLLIALGWLLWPNATTRLTENSSKLTTAAATTPDNAKSNQLASAKHSAIVDAQTAADTGLRITQPPTTATLAPAAATEAAAKAPGLESTAHSTTAIAAGPTAKSVLSTATARLHFSAVAGAMPSRRRNSADSRLAYHGIMAPQAARLTNGRRSSSTQLEHNSHNSASAPTAKALARQAGGRISTLAKNADQHPAAGSLAAPTEAPAEAVVADAVSPGQLRRESQSPLLHQAAALPATSVNARTAASAPEASASASASALAMLTPLAIRLSSAAPAGLPAPLALVAEVPANLPVPVRQPRFYIGLVAAPDVTTVKFTSVERPMLNLGVMLEYRITNRLRVNTGLLRSTKQYVARREDYDFGTASTRVYQRDFADVEGACTVLDVPLNLRYDIVAHPEYRLFGSVGLSSFFMQRESYSYEYEENNMAKYWNGSAVNQNRHLLSILNLSAGYERSFSSHWSVQAEPYFKVPLAGVGLGKVRLTSAGVFFGVKYGF